MNNMFNGITRILLVFENCEVAEIDGRHIIDFNISNIQNHIQRIACNDIRKMAIADEVMMSFSRNGDKEYSCFGMPSDKHSSTYDRVATYNDITSIEIFYGKELDDKTIQETGSSGDIYVRYKGEETNEYQDTHLNQSGDLFVVISKEKNVASVFGDIMDDEETMQDTIRWYGA